MINKYNFHQNALKNTLFFPPDYFVIVPIARYDSMFSVYPLNANKLNKRGN